MDEFAGRVAVVAGGSLGIGRAAAIRLAAGGASVVLCGRRREAVEEAVSVAREGGGAVDGLAADVSTAEGVRRLVDHAVAAFGGVDILVNSAGIQRYGTVTETDEATWDEVMTINLKSMYLCAREAIPRMRERGGGAIVNVSSVQAFATQKGVAAYGTSKAAINGLTRSMALDHAEENIRVNVVCPASVDTPMLRWSADLFKGEGSQQRMLDAWGGMHPLGRIAQPEEVAELIAFLASDRAAFITGGEYKIDGGMMAARGPPAGGAVTATRLTRPRNPHGPSLRAATSAPGDRACVVERTPGSTVMCLSRRARPGATTPSTSVVYPGIGEAVGVACCAPNAAGRRSTPGPPRQPRSARIPTGYASPVLLPSMRGSRGNHSHRSQHHPPRRSVRSPSSGRDIGPSAPLSGFPLGPTPGR